MSDTRIVYGARCTWWDSIDKVATLPTLSGQRGLPCCPHCKGVLYEVSSEAAWFSSVDSHEAGGRPGYRAMVEWGRGKCFPGYGPLTKAYAEREKGVSS